MTNTITAFKHWMRIASSTEQQMLAERVGSSVGMLYHYSNGIRHMSVERAAAVEEVTKEMSRASKGRLPIVYRTDTVDTCRSCPYAQRCLGDRALASEFPVVQG